MFPRKEMWEGLHQNPLVGIGVCVLSRTKFTVEIHVIRPLPHFLLISIIL